MDKKVIFFDLFSTLVSLNNHNSHVPRACDHLGIDQLQWNRVSMSQYHDRGIGIVDKPFDIVSNIARTIEPDLSDEAIEEALAIRVQRFRHCVTKPEAAIIDALGDLKSAGFRLGLISNADVIDIMGWPESPLSGLFESVIFSCRVGVAKPDHGIYQLAMKEMEVEARDCVFVGDGGSDELGGARKLGMSTVMTVQYRWQSDEILERLEKDADHTIGNLKELLDLVSVSISNK